MRKDKYNGFASKEQYEAVKKEVAKCLKKSKYNVNEFISTLGVYYGEDNLVYVYLDGLFVTIYIGDINISWPEDENRNEIKSYELDIIYQLKNFDYGCIPDLNVNGACFW